MGSVPLGGSPQRAAPAPAPVVQREPRAPRPDLNMKQVGNADDVKQLLAQLGGVKTTPSPCATPSKSRAAVDDEAPSTAYSDLIAATTKLNAVMGSSCPPSCNNSFEQPPPDDGNFTVHEEAVKYRLKEIAGHAV